MEVTEPLLQIPVTKVVHIKLTVISILVVNSNQPMYTLVIFSIVKWIEKVKALAMRKLETTFNIKFQTSCYFYFRILKLVIQIQAEVWERIIQFTS